MPLVTAIVRSMDRPTLHEALQSIAAQAYRRIEVVLVNAKGRGHRDVAPLDNGVPLRVVQGERPLERSAAANAGLDAAAGDLIFFLDDDDLVFPDHVASLVQALSSQPGSLGAYAGVRIEHYRSGRLGSVSEENRAFDRDWLWGRNFLPIHAVLFSRELLRRGCRFDEQLSVYEDWDFWVQVTRQTDLVQVDRVTSCYRNHGSSGFGLFDDPGFIRRSKARFFEKWKGRWSGDELASILARREAMLEAAEHATRLEHLESVRQHERAELLRAELAAASAQLVSAQDQRAAAEQAVDALKRSAAALRAEIGALQTAKLALSVDLSQAHLEAEQLRLSVRAAFDTLATVYASRSWRMTGPYRRVGTWVRRARTAVRLGRAYARSQGPGVAGYAVLAGRVLRVLHRHGFKGLEEFARRHPAHRWPVATSATHVIEAKARRPLAARTDAVDVIVCVHNALVDVQNCLSSVLAHTTAPYRILIVDDGSSTPTADYLAQFAADTGAALIRNELARGYTFAANQGMRAAQASALVLLNSDTIVSAGWLDRLAHCAESDARVGIVGPLSNTASWQSVPRFEDRGDWATNPLPAGVSIEDMAGQIAAFSAQSYPRIPLLNGFCLFIKRSTLDQVGLFDEASFGKGYGEENDLCLRAHKAGIVLAVADDVYVHHAQSRSYSTERRKLLSEHAGIQLASKHTQAFIDQCVERCRYDRTLAGIRHHSAQLAERLSLTRRGRERWEGKRVTFVLPVQDAGGGSNVVIVEARAMRRMGVDVQILNFSDNRGAFEAAYPAFDLDVVYADDEASIPALCRGSDAVIATMNTSVYWIAPLLAELPCEPRLGYYVQDYEPNFYPEDSAEREAALRSYTVVPEMVLLTKTPWNAQVVQHRTGRHCAVVGASFDVDLFRPAPRSAPSWPQGPIGIVAMIRPSSPRRGTRLTMDVLRTITSEFGERISVTLFGVHAEDPAFLRLSPDPRWRIAGLLSPQRMASLLNASDVFVDFSHYQAMGLTAMEAMGCGAAVIVPREGGASCFATHEATALVVDTFRPSECLAALRRLLTDHDLRLRLQRDGAAHIAQFTPEAAAYRFLEALLP